MRASSRHIAEWVPASELPLFDLKDTPIRAPKRVAETSAESYRELGPSLQGRRAKVYAALSAQSEPVTTYELFQWMAARKQARDVNDVRPRTSELFDDGKIERCEKRRCAVTGKKAFTWRAR